ncbi:glutamate ABC transporter substrate-binding protein [Kineococcus sp. DHX-1]|uniref:glutamate ABC transporter substrate-binding protein n=1 Tax=Kineococcus sp. DHX-1 TaxID=3349638 RepID=UPI0036D3DC9B
MRSLRSLTLAGTAATLLALTACGGGGGQLSGEDAADQPTAEASASFEAGTKMADISSAKKITIGTKFDQPGFGEANLENKPEGFDVDVAEYIAAKLGVAPDAISWVPAPSAQREDLIANGDVDLVVATYTINDKRKERITFAGPYYVAGQQIMVAKDNTTITGPDSLKTNPDQKICSVTGSTPAENIRQYLADPGQLVEFAGYSDCAAQLQSGQVAAVTTDNVILTGLVAKSNDAFKLVGEQFTEEPYGIGITKGDTKFCEFINSTLKEMSDDGSYEEAWKATAGKYEGTELPTLPTADACA